MTLDADTHIEVPEDRYGLYAIDMLDPDMVGVVPLCFLRRSHDRDGHFMYHMFLL